MTEDPSQDPTEFSILANLQRQGRRAPRVHLRKLDADEGERTGGIGRYEVRGEIARGGVGIVLKGRDVDLGRDVAMKVLREEHAGKPDLVQRFVEEAQIGGQLQHPGIVPIYELGLRDDRQPYFSMKLVKGETLAALLGKRESPAHDVRRLVGIFEQVCQTMAYAHSRGVIHRDLKPSNIMVGAFGEVQVVDWGFAKVLQQGGIADERKAKRARDDSTVITTARTASQDESEIGSVMGTPAYMPPEQALGRVEELDERSDVFALGAILCEILTGKPAYHGDAKSSLRAASQARLEAAEEALRTCGADEDLVRIARDALQPTRRKRPANAGILAQRVAAYTASLEERAHRAALEAAQAREAAARERRAAAEGQAAAEEARAAAERADADVEQQQRARRQAFLLGSAAVVLVVIAVGTFFWVRKVGRDERRETARRVEASMQEAREHRAAGDLGAAAAAARHAVELSYGKSVARVLADTGAQPGHDVRRPLLLLQDINGEQAANVAESERRRRNDEFVRRLSEIRLSRTDVMADIDTEEVYGDAFREFGVDVATLPVAETADYLRKNAPEIMSDVAGYLDDWALDLHSDRGLDGKNEKGELVARLFDVATAIDPDPWRRKLRAAIVADDKATLKALASESDVEALTPKSMVLLGVALGFSTIMEDADAGEAVTGFLRRAVLVHPDDLWLRLAMVATSMFAIIGQVGDEDFEAKQNAAAREGVRHLTAAAALRPGSAAILGFRAMLRMHLKDYESAAADFEDAMPLLEGEERAAIAAAWVNMLWLQKEYERALKAAETSLTANPESAVLRSQVADMLMRGPVRDVKRALTLAVEARDLFPEQHASYDWIVAKAQYENGLYRDVLATCGPLITEDGERQAFETHAVILSGLAHAALNETDKAQAFYDEAAAVIQGRPVLEDIAPYWVKLKALFEESGDK